MVGSEGRGGVVSSEGRGAVVGSEGKGREWWAVKEEGGGRGMEW